MTYSPDLIDKTFPPWLESFGKHSGLDLKRASFHQAVGHRCVIFSKGVTDPCLVEFLTEVSWQDMEISGVKAHEEELISSQ